MYNIISSVNPQNNINNQSSSINPQFINKKRENNFTAKKIKKRTGDMIKNRFYSSLQKDIKSNKNFLKKKEKNRLKNIKLKILIEIIQK